MNNNSPIVVVLSGSMEPGYKRGDLLLVSGETKRPYVPGDIVVFPVKGYFIPIVHRVLRVFTGDEQDATYDGLTLESAERGLEKVLPQKILTKGDNNEHADNFLYTDKNILTSCVDVGEVKGGVRGLLENAMKSTADDCLRKSDVMGRVLWCLPGIGYVTILLRKNIFVTFLIFGGMAILTILGGSG